MPTATAIVQQRLAALNAQDLDNLRQLYHPAAVLFWPDIPDVGSLEDALDWWQRTFEAYPDAELVVERQFRAGTTVISEWSFHGTNTGPLISPLGAKFPPTGQRVLWRGVDLVTVEGGQISVERRYADQLELAMDLGVVQPRTSPTA